MPSKNPTERNSTADTPGVTDRISNAASDVTDKISNAASTAQSKVSELGRTAADKVDENRDAAASGLKSVASTLHEKADSLPGGEKVTGLAHSAADTLSSTADYVRDHDVNSMMADLERLVKNNPGPSLLAAAAIGFLVGRTLSSD
jgi:ElaB/YqjD/DUF883 family membrane-anchored ribosome-binding protein